MSKKNVLLSTSFFHFLQDGHMCSIFVLIPFISREFELTLSQAGLIKFCLSGIASAFQIPAVFIAEKIGEAASLIGGFAWISVGYAIMALSPSFLALIVLTLIAGLGHSVQHPIANSMVSKVYQGGRLGTSIGTLNFSGDLGKVCVPFLVTMVVSVYGWRSGLLVLGGMGVPISLAASFYRKTLFPPEAKNGGSAGSLLGKESGFGALKTESFRLFSLIGIIDCSTRITVFTFIAFLALRKGSSADKVGFILTILFFGGIFGKFVCGYLADRIGAARVIMVSELATALLLIFILRVSLFYFVPLILILGVTLNGSSSVLYSLVPVFFQSESRTRGYALFYTIYLSAGAVGPLLYGALGDAHGLNALFVCLSIATLFTLPLTALLARTRKFA